MIELKSEGEIKIMAEGGKILAEIFEKIPQLNLVGMTTEQVDALIEQYIFQRHAKPAFKGHRDYPASTCISINRQVVHALPNQTIICAGDLISIDAGIIWKKFYLDRAITFQLPPVNPAISLLIKTTQQALDEAIKVAVPGNTTDTIARAVYSTAKKKGFKVICGLTGHGIGRNLQEEPIVPNIPVRQKPVELVPGMVIAIEPMLTTTDGKITTEPDGWTVITQQHGFSAHFEHTVAIIAKGNKVLTV